MLPQFEALNIMLFSDDKLKEGYKKCEIRFCCFKALALKYPNELDEFLFSGLDNAENLVDVYIKNCLALDSNKWDIDDIVRWFEFLNSEIMQLQSNDKKIRLNALKGLITLTEVITRQTHRIIKEDKEKKDLLKNIIVDYPIKKDLR